MIYHQPTQNSEQIVKKKHIMPIIIISAAVMAVTALILIFALKSRSSEFSKPSFSVNGKNLQNADAFYTVRDDLETVCEEYYFLGEAESEKYAVVIPFCHEPAKEKTAYNLSDIISGRLSILVTYRDSEGNEYSGHIDRTNNNTETKVVIGNISPNDYAEIYINAPITLNNGETFIVSAKGKINYLSKRP